MKAAAAYAAANPKQAWLRGRGWNQEIWKLGRFPTAAELDGAVADRPVWLERVDGHAGWANSRALKLAGITNATPDPAGGKIMRDANGNATGVLVDAAQDLVNKVLPKQTEAEARVDAGPLAGRNRPRRPDQRARRRHRGRQRPPVPRLRRPRQADHPRLRA